MDDKEDPSMFDEVLEGGGHPRILIANLLNSFVLQNVGFNGFVV